MRAAAAALRAGGDVGPIAWISCAASRDAHDGAVLGRAVLRHVDAHALLLLTSARDEDLVRAYARHGFSVPDPLLLTRPQRGRS